jgi:hypothetical protein
LNRDLIRAFDDMIICQDRSVGTDDHTRADASLKLRSLLGLRLARYAAKQVVIAKRELHHLISLGFDI